MKLFKWFIVNFADYKDLIDKYNSKKRFIETLKKSNNELYDELEMKKKAYNRIRARSLRARNYIHKTLWIDELEIEEVKNILEGKNVRK